MCLIMNIVYSSQTEMLKFLLEAGADLYIINDVRFSDLIAAVFHFSLHNTLHP